MGKNSRPGVAALVVLFVIMAATIISLSFIARSDVELAFGNNMALRMQMDYIAEAGLEHAKALITNPQDADTAALGYWAGGEDFSLKDFDFYGLLDTGDYYDITVTRDDSDPTDRCSYDITCHAYRLDGTDEIAQSDLEARLRLDPCIAYWAGAATSVSSRITVNGDAYCGGTLTNQGTINGDVHASALVGTVEGKWYDTGTNLLDVDLPELEKGDFAPTYYYYLDEAQHTPQVFDGNDIFADIPFTPNVSNPAGVIVCNGNVTLMGNVTINGTLVVDGDITLQGANNVITAVKNFPAIVVVDGEVIIEATGQLTVNGLVQTEQMTIASGAGDVTILGGLFVSDSGIDVDPGYTGNITLTAAPVSASLDISADKWTPIGGSFYKWIKRR
ncbi:MAG: hypothetical protein ACYTFK_12870 [Planctomycetota bacterium]